MTATIPALAADDSKSADGKFAVIIYVLTVVNKV